MDTPTSALLLLPPTAPPTGSQKEADVTSRLRQQAFMMLALPSLRAVYAGALAVVNRRADAEDVAQDALLAAFEKIDTCRDPARFRAWLLQIVRNRALNWIESRRLRDVPATDAPPPVEAVLPAMPDAGLRQRISAAMSALSATQRQVVLLHDTEGWMHQEIADRLGISVLMSRKHLFQARGTLRALLAHDRPAEITGQETAPPPPVLAAAPLRPLDALRAVKSSRRGNAGARSAVPQRKRSVPVAPARSAVLESAATG